MLRDVQMLTVHNHAWGRQCQFCDQPVLSDNPSTFVCQVHYITRCLEVGMTQASIPDYNSIQPTHSITLYVDGSCEGNPGPGGYGIVMVAHDSAGKLIKQRQVNAGIGTQSTNNQAELMGAIAALRLLDQRIIDRFQLVHVVSDSQYLVKGISEYIYAWMTNGWRTTSKSPVANQELWQTLWALCDDLGHRPTFTWTKGHSKSLLIDSRLNNMADSLALAAARTQTKTDTVILL